MKGRFTFVGVDLGSEAGDFHTEAHGHFDDNGRLVIAEIQTWQRTIDGTSQRVEAIAERKGGESA